MTAFDNLLTVGILLALFIILYSSVTGKSLFDMIREGREGFAAGGSNAVEKTKGGFEDIR